MEGSSLKKNKATLVLVIINVAIWIITQALGDTMDAEYMYSCGAMSTYGTLVDHEYWRFFTSIFLHFGPQHLLNNMLVLSVAGVYLERAIGSIRYLIAYIISGVLGSVTSCLYMLYQASYGVSAGASGAVFGLVGGLIVIVAINHWSYDGIDIKGIVLCAALMVMSGLSSQAVDNAAHVGGLVSGIIITAVIWTFSPKLRNRKESESHENGDINEG